MLIKETHFPSISLSHLPVDGDYHGVPVIPLPETMILYGNSLMSGRSSSTWVVMVSDDVIPRLSIVEIWDNSVGATRTAHQLIGLMF